MSHDPNSRKSLPDGLHRQTLAVRAAVDRSQYGENSEALFLTSGFVQESAESQARRFGGEEEGDTYGRSGNPTVRSMEMRLAALVAKGASGRADDRASPRAAPRRTLSSRTVPEGTSALPALA